MANSKKFKIEKTVEKTDEGIGFKTNMLTLENFSVKEEGKGVYSVVDSDGKAYRKYGSECSDPKACAESYAKKLSSQWHK